MLVEENLHYKSFFGILHDIKKGTQGGTMNVRDFTSDEKISKEYHTSLWYHYMYKGSSKIH